MFFYHSMRSIQGVTFLSLYHILMLIFDVHYFPVKVISKQVAIIVSHSHLLLFLHAHDFTLSS